MCWHRIRNDEDKEPKCPNCRKLYGDEPFQFAALTAVQEEKLKHLTQTRPNKGKISIRRVFSAVF